MKLRLGADGALRYRADGAPQGRADGAGTRSLPGDLTGQVVTVDLRHIDIGHDDGAAALLSELLTRGAARLVIAGTDEAGARALLASAQHDAPPSGLAA